MKSTLAIALLFLCWSQAICQEVDSVQLLKAKVADFESSFKTLKSTELAQSMAQRSLLTPSYFSELKALVARQAYNLWLANDGDRLVSHLNIYSALYYANKYLGYDSIHLRSYNEAIGHNASVVSVQYGSDPNIFYSAGSDGKVIKWRLDEGFNTPEVIYEGNQLIRSLDISSDDQWLLVVTKEQGIVMLDNRPPGPLEDRPVAARDPEPVQTAVFVPGENMIAVVNRKGELKLKSFGEEEIIGTTNQKVTSMKANSSKNILLGTAAGSVQVWEDTLTQDFYLPEAFAVNTMAISSDFKTLALGREKGDVILWNLESKSLIRTISGHQSAITAVDFDPGDNLLLSASRDGTVRVWDMSDSRKLPLVLDDHNDWVMTACFSPDGQRIISGSRDNFIRFWPVYHKELADRVCELVSRNLTEAEWKEYLGEGVPYTETCPLN